MTTPRRSHVLVGRPEVVFEVADGHNHFHLGTSAGWRDVDDKELAYQWVDVSSTAPGTYVVGSEADPENRIWEGGGAAEVNPPAFAAKTVTVPGWTAQPVTVTSQSGASARHARPFAAPKVSPPSVEGGSLMRRYRAGAGRRCPSLCLGVQGRAPWAGAPTFARTTASEAR